jgi:hypothetical protein
MNKALRFFALICLRFICLSVFCALHGEKHWKSVTIWFIVTVTCQTTASEQRYCDGHMSKDGERTAITRQRWRWFTAITCVWVFFWGWAVLVVAAVRWLRWDDGQRRCRAATALNSMLCKACY